ncbi:MAG: hypothetical protein QNJ42_25620 [Crocosphaera sp.]|nr:hypothetical protein [Crocosphaera sp.]
MKEDLIKLRIWGKSNHIEQDTKEIIKALESIHYQVIEVSKPYQCRPPNNDESRTYLTIIKTA